MLARFLYNYYQVPIVWNGPRGDGQQLRPQSQVDRDNEIKRAIELCDAALKIDERDANAMATKGWVLYTIKAVGPEELADRGLVIDPDNVRLLELKATVVLDHASDFCARRRLLVSAPVTQTPTGKPARSRRVRSANALCPHGRATGPGRGARSQGGQSARNRPGSCRTIPNT